MKLATDSFPYPVLSSQTDDYIDGSFTVDYKSHLETTSKIKLEIKFNLNDSGLEKLISEGRATYAVHLEGISSSYRELYTLDKYQDEISVYLSAEKIGSAVEMNTMIVSTNNIDSYRDDNFNPEYYDDDYNIKRLNKGDILAFAPYKKFDFKRKNKSNPNTKSMIRVSMTEEEYMSVDTDSDVIYVRLPKDIYNNYVQLSKSSKALEDMMKSTIILPALTCVLTKIQQGESLGDYDWYDVLIKLLDGIQISLSDLKNEDAMIVAQRLLDNPLKTAFMEYSEEIGD